ncbi:hypothetical protein NPIL_463521 [Nephila pilipes]|uniref:Uncharacterized protein n=1 Tax=Nephila pilipes TaxID=299642 RepID=A0A8X6QUA2_NEPPI|nr:hypothetical protein NPIL_463521 [Nephila pilipes]
MRRKSPELREDSKSVTQRHPYPLQPTLSTTPFRACIGACTAHTASVHALHVTSRLLPPPNGIDIHASLVKAFENERLRAQPILYNVLAISLSIAKSTGLLGTYEVAGFRDTGGIHKSYDRENLSYG